MRKLIFLGVLFCSLVLTSFQGAITYLTNPSPVRMSLADFVKKPPKAKWVELSNCEIDYANALQVTSRRSKAIEALYVPVRATGQKTPARVLLKLDRQMQREFSDLTTGNPRAANAMISHAVNAGLNRSTTTGNTISGLVQYGLDTNTRQYRALVESPLVADGFVVIEDGAKPAATGVVVLIAVGVTMLGVVGWALTIGRPGRAERGPANEAEWAQWAKTAH